MLVRWKEIIFDKTRQPEFETVLVVRRSVAATKIGSQNARKKTRNPRLVVRRSVAATKVERNLFRSARAEQVPRYKMRARKQEIHD